jgi:hypothetical protein
MSSIVYPSSSDCIQFIRLYFGPQVKHEYVSPNNHHVFIVEGRTEPISIPLERDSIADRTFHNILQCAGINVQEFRQLAGDSKKMRDYLKSQRKALREDQPGAPG